MILVKDSTDDIAKPNCYSGQNLQLAPDLAAFGGWVVLIHRPDNKSDRAKFM